jgi:catechol 2,3-dioxygenase-like lactoylglutathione lyase family enzyme
LTDQRPVERPASSGQAHGDADRPVRRLAGVDLEVANPEGTVESLSHLIDLLPVGDRGGALGLGTNPRYGAVAAEPVLGLLPGAGPRLRRLRLVIGDGTVAALTARLERAGVTPADVGDAGGPGTRGLAFTDPWGLEVVCHTEAAGDHAGGSRPPSSDVRPRRLGHVNVKVPDAVGAAAFYQDALGLRLSERVGDLLTFLRVGSEHHNLGFRSGAATTNLHHVALEVAGWETLRLLCDRIADRGHVVEYGPGRHGPGRNLFVYLVEPASGLRLELYTDMAHIDNDEAYQPIEWEGLDRARTMNRWGPAPPTSFLE